MKKKTVLTIILIFAGILIVFIVKEFAFPGFNLFKFIKLLKTTDILENTSLEIESVEKISKLSIAEYYGEVINALFEEDMETKLPEIKDIYEKYRTYLTKTPGIAVYSLENIRENLRESSDQKELSDSFLIIRMIHNSISNRYFSGTKKYIQENGFGEYYEKYKKKIEKEYDRQRLKIAYLARGKTILSFDLEGISGSNRKEEFDYDEKNNILTLGLDLNIETIINPYFIYSPDPHDSSKAIEYPGYRVLKDKNNKFTEATVDKVKWVKRGCNIKLLKMAVKDEEFLNTVLENAEITLANFISLFKEIKIKDKTYEIAEGKFKVHINIRKYRYKEKEMDEEEYKTFVRNNPI